MFNNSLPKYSIINSWLNKIPKSVEFGTVYDNYIESRLPRLDNALFRPCIAST